jgi:hypothetical protein
MLTPNCYYRATPLLLNQQCMHECCVWSPMGSLTVAEYTFSERASAREPVTLCVCVCVCATVWGLTLPILVLAVSLTWLLTHCPPDGNRHTPEAADISVAWQLIYVAALSALMAQQTSLHKQHNYMTVIYQVYTWYMTLRYIPVIWQVYDQLFVIYLSHDRYYMTIYLSYTCHMTGIWLMKVCHMTIWVIWQVYTHFKLSALFRYRSRYGLDLSYACHITVTITPEYDAHFQIRQALTGDRNFRIACELGVQYPTLKAMLSREDHI